MTPLPNKLGAGYFDGTFNQDGLVVKARSRLNRLAESHDTLISYLEEREEAKGRGCEFCSRIELNNIHRDMKITIPEELKPAKRRECCDRCNGYKSEKYPNRPDCKNPHCLCHQPPKEDPATGSEVLSSAKPHKCSDPDLSEDCSGCTDPHSEGTHQGCTKQHGHIGCDEVKPTEDDVQIIADALTHGRTKPLGTDAAYLTKRLRRLILSKQKDVFYKLCEGLNRTIMSTRRENRIGILDDVNNYLESFGKENLTPTP